MAFVELVNLSKRFPGVTALSEFSLSLERNEVHAVVGANGAGKSTLMNILAGAMSPDGGEILIDGEKMRRFTPRTARELGISVVYQDFHLVPQLSVACNIYLGREPVTAGGLVDTERLHADAGELLRSYEFALDPADPIERLTVAQRQLVEIARALSIEARIIILDEPTAVLSLVEQTSLFAIINRLKERGILVVYVSHRLNEIFTIADRVTVIRDGRKIATVGTADVDESELVRMMIGHTVRQSFALPSVAPQTARSLDVTYRANGSVSTFNVRAGEILGLAGFVGAGRSYLARALVGLGRDAEVTIRRDAEVLAPTGPKSAMSAGIVYLTEDRKREGLFANLSILANSTAAVLGSFSRFGIIQRTAERVAGDRILRRLRLVARSLVAPVSELSGGNQQKVIFGRAMLTAPKVLICDEPTRGVDVGAKDEIYDLLIELASQGVAIILISSEVKELLALTHRIVVMRDRRIVATWPTPEASEESILLAASGGRNANPQRATR